MVTLLQNTVRGFPYIVTNTIMWTERSLDGDLPDDYWGPHCSREMALLEEVLLPGFGYENMAVVGRLY